MWRRNTCPKDEEHCLFQVRIGGIRRNLHKLLGKIKGNLSIESKWPVHHPLSVCNCAQWHINFNGHAAVVLLPPPTPRESIHPCLLPAKYLPRTIASWAVVARPSWLIDINTHNKNSPIILPIRRGQDDSLTFTEPPSWCMCYVVQGEKREEECNSHSAL